MNFGRERERESAHITSIGNIHEDFTNLQAGPARNRASLPHNTELMAPQFTLLGTFRLLVTFWKKNYVDKKFYKRE